MDSDSLEEELHISRLIIIYKFILGLIELLLGLGIYFFGKIIIILYLNFKDNEFLEDPHDLLVRITETVLPYVLDHKNYIILILILLGLVKMIGALGLFYRKHWGLDLMMGLTIILLPFEFYALIVHPSLLKLAFVIINLFIALYLVQFKPKRYFLNLKGRIKK